MIEIQIGGTTALDIAQFVALIVAAALAGFTAWQGFHAARSFRSSECGYNLGGRRAAGGSVPRLFSPAPSEGGR